MRDKRPELLTVVVEDAAGEEDFLLLLLRSAETVARQNNKTNMFIYGNLNTRKILKTRQNKNRSAPIITRGDRINCLAELTA